MGLRAQATLEQGISDGLLRWESLLCLAAAALWLWPAVLEDTDMLYPRVCSANTASSCHTGLCDDCRVGTIGGFYLGLEAQLGGMDKCVVSVG